MTYLAFMYGIGKGPNTIHERKLVKTQGNLKNL